LPGWPLAPGSPRWPGFTFRLGPVRRAPGGPPPAAGVGAGGRSPPARGGAGGGSGAAAVAGGRRAPGPGAVRAPAARGWTAPRRSVHADRVVTDDAHPTRGVVGRPAQYAVAATLTRVRAEGRPTLAMSVRILVLGTDPAWQRVLPGQRVVVDGQLGRSDGGDLRSAVLSAPGTPRLVGRAWWAQRAAGRLRAGLRQACAPLPPD